MATLPDSLAFLAVDLGLMTKLLHPLRRPVESRSPFNLGNVIGAWLGGIILERCPGLTSILLTLFSRAPDGKPMESMPECEA